MLTDSPNLISTPSGLTDDHFISSDHFILSFSASFSAPVYNPRRPSPLVPDYSSADWTSLVDHLLDFNLTYLYASNKVNSTWKFLKEAIIAACDLHIPKILIRYQ